MYSDDGLGALPLAPVVGVFSSLFGGNPKDANRIATNTRAYNQAVSGQDGPFEGFASGLEFLRVHSVAGDADGGWATAAATKDAMQKYQKALGVIGGARSSTASTGATGGLNPVGQGGGFTAPDPRQALGAITGGLPLILAGVVVAVALSRRR